MLRFGIQKARAVVELEVAHSFLQPKTYERNANKHRLTNKKTQNLQEYYGANTLLHLNTHLPQFTQRGAILPSQEDFLGRPPDLFSYPGDPR